MANFLKKIRINEKVINFLLIFILGFLVGVAVKTEAKRRITIGYGDYLVAGMKHDFDLTKPETKPEEQQSAPDGDGQQDPADTSAEQQ